MNRSGEHIIDVGESPEELSVTTEKPSRKPHIQSNNAKAVFSAIKSWYKPVRVEPLDEPAEKKPKLRYCNGQLTLQTFIFLHFVILLLSFTIIFVPLVYFLIIPAFVRYKIKRVDLNDVEIDRLDIIEWKSNGFRFSWKATLPRQFFLPLKTKLAALNLRVRDAHSNILLTTYIPELEINLAEPIVLEFDGDVLFEETSKLKNFLGEISQSNDIQKSNSISVDTQITVNVWGITWYKDLDIKRIIRLPKLDGNLLTLWNVMPKFLIAKNMRYMTSTLTNDANDTIIKIEGVNVPDVNKPLIIDGVEYWQFLPGFPPINLQSFDLEFTNEGLNIALRTLIINPTVFSVPLPDISIGLQLEDSYLATSNIKGFNLMRGLNDLDLNLQLTFDQSRIVDPKQLSNSISEAIGKLLGIYQSNEGLNFNITGPIELKDVDFIRTVTEKLSLTLPINEIIKNTSDKLLNISGIDSLLHAIHFDVMVEDDKIIVPVDITLPSFLPLPSSLEFKYKTSFGVFKNEQNVFRVGLSEISMTKNESLTVQTTVMIVPNNSLEAADALASIVNPSLLGNISSVDIKNFTFLDETGRTFSWVNRLFGNLSPSIPIPGFSTTAIINMLTQKGTSIPVKMLGTKVTQRSDITGFDVNGAIAIEYPPSLPVITISTGYVETAIYTDDVLLATTKLPNGIEYISRDTSTDIIASAILSKDDKLKSIIAELITGVLSMKNDIEMPIIGIRGIKLGVSESQSFVTFSKIVVPINLATLKPTMKTAVETISRSIQQKTALLSLVGIDFAIVSSNSLLINIQSVFDNPTNIITDIGSISFTTTLNYDELANITILPIQLAFGKIPLNLQMKIDIVNDKDRMSDHILQFYNDLINIKGNFRSIIGIKNLSIAPPIVEGENVDTTLATIDQFSTAHITVPSSLISAENLRTINSINVIEMIKNPKNNMIDISGILSTETTFTLPTLTSVSVETKKSSQLQIGATFCYINPLPVSGKIPYFSATIVLDGKDFVTFSISEIDLKRSRGDMSVTTHMVFHNSKGIDSAINEFLNNILNGEIKQKIELNGIYFGETRENENDLLSLLKLPLPTDLINVNYIKNKLIELSPIKLPFSLDQLLFNPQYKLLKSVDITTSSDGVLSLKISTQLNVPFKINVDIGYISINGITLNNKRFTSIEISRIRTVDTGFNDVSFGIKLSFSNKRSISKSFKGIYDSLVDDKFILTKGGINGIKIGTSEDDFIRTFERISISTEIGNLIKGQLDLNRIIDSILVDSSNNSTLISADQGTISIDISNLAQIVINQLGIKILPGNIIEMKTKSSITLPFSLTMNIGFARTGIFLDDLPVVNMFLSATSEGRIVSISNSIKIFDSNKLADKLGDLTKNFLNNSPLVGNLSIRNPVIGTSKDDTINTFSLISLDLSLEKLFESFIKNKPKLIDPIVLIDQIGFRIEALDISTVAQHKVSTKFKVSFNNNFPVTIEVGFIELSLGLDSINFVDISSSDLSSIGSGTNNGLSVVSSLSFRVSDNHVQDKIASFVSSLQKHSLGNTDELLSVSRIKIGFSPNNFIKAFEKVIVGIPSSSVFDRLIIEKLLGMAGLSLYDLTVERMLNRLDIGSVSIKMNPNGQELAIEGNVGIKNIPLSITADIGMVTLSIALNAFSFTKVILPDIKIISYNNIISTNFTMILIIQDSDGLQDEIATIAKSLIEENNDTIVPGDVNFSELLFGDSNSDIDTFSKMIISIPLNPILQPIKSIIINIIIDFFNGTGNIKLLLDDVTIGIKNSKTLTTDIVANLFGLPAISFNIPFASVDISIDGQFFISAVINEMKFEEGQFKTSAELEFQDNKILANQLAVLGSEIVFRRLTNTLLLQFGIDNLIFGPSSQKTYGLTKKISLSMEVGKFINKFSDFNQKNNLISLDNIQSRITQQGIEATVINSAIPNLPLNLNIPAVLGHVFFQDVPGAIVRTVIKPNVRKNQPTWEFVFLMFIQNDQMSQALKTAVPNLLAFKSYSQGSSLGGAFLCHVDDCLDPPNDSFNIFSESRFIPPPLFLYNPITVELVRVFPTFILNVLFVNTGPLKIDIGNFILSLEKDGKSIIKLFSSKSIIINNTLENSGQNVIPIEAKLTLDPLQIPKLLLDLVDPRNDFIINLKIIRDDIGEVKWINDLLKNLPRTVLNNLIPILLGLLKNIKLGFDLNGRNFIIRDEKISSGTKIVLGNDKVGNDVDNVEQLAVEP